MNVIRVIDFETTGFEPPAAEVCEVGWCDMSQQDDGGWIVWDPKSYLCGVQAIPPETRAVHHITMSEVGDAAPFSETALIEGASHCAAIAAHNAEFEKKFIPNADGVMPMICTYKAALRVWPDAPSHSNGALRYWLEDQGLLSLDHDKAMPPHRAGPDAYVTAHIMKALLRVATGREMVAWTKLPRLLPTCPIGKEKGKKWADVDHGFLKWMTLQATMEHDLRWNALEELKRRETA